MDKTYTFSDTISPDTVLTILVIAGALVVAVVTYFVVGRYAVYGKGQSSSLLVRAHKYRWIAILAAAVIGGLLGWLLGEVSLGTSFHISI